MDEASRVNSNSALVRVRQKLDAGLGDTMVKKYRDSVDLADIEWLKHEAEYKFIILGALMMGAGAKIKHDDLQHLRQFASEVRSHENFTLPLWDTGFRGPGKRQFLAALENYTPGTARSFNDPSCHACGKTKQDTQKAPLMCAGCSNAWFCDKVC